MKTASAFVMACTFLYGTALSAQKTTTLKIDLIVFVATVSPTLYGLMTEEINYSYDGGLYPEMVRNRAFNTLTALLQ
jgi:alpha-N-arabinofuranosidase